MRRHAFGVDDRETGALEDLEHRLQGIEAQVLVVDRVVLQLLDEVQKVVRLRDECSFVANHVRDAAQLGEEVVDVREHVRSRDDGDVSVLGDDL